MKHALDTHQPGPPPSLDEIVAVYTKLALRELNVPDADARVDKTN